MLKISLGLEHFSFCIFRLGMVNLFSFTTRKAGPGKIQEGSLSKRYQTERGSELLGHWLFWTQTQDLEVSAPVSLGSLPCSSLTTIPQIVFGGPELTFLLIPPLWSLV